jgi:hypothetical protein
MSLEELLSQIRARRLMLTYGAALWAPNTSVDAATRRAIREHRAQLAALIQQADIRTCASPLHHRSYYRYVGDRRYVCEMCEQIEDSRSTQSA